MAPGKKLTYDEVAERFAKAGAELVGEYKNANTPCLVRCKIHGTKRLITPASIFAGNGLKCCDIERRRLTADDVADRLRSKGYVLKSSYSGLGGKISVLCEKHRQEHVVPAIGVVSGGKNLPCCGRESTSKKMTGREVSDEFRLGCSERQQGDKAYWSGKSFTVEHREKISTGGARHYASSVDSHIAHARRGATAGKPGWFYIFRVGDLLKFGSVSRMTPEKRIAKIRRDTGLLCFIEIAVQVDDAGNYEAAMMNEYREYWVRHEYFRPELLGVRQSS